jgi:hypothetical protein
MFRTLLLVFAAIAAVTASDPGLDNSAIKADSSIEVLLQLHSFSALKTIFSNSRHFRPLANAGFAWAEPDRPRLVVNNMTWLFSYHFVNFCPF